MNKVHRIIWNEALQMWMAVAENAKGHSKSSRSVASAKRRLKLAALAAALVTGSAGLQTAYAGPAGGQVTSGVGSIAQSGPTGATTTTINQSTQNLSLDWKSFNVGSRETVNFVQPSATAIAVNKIFDTNGSQILGNLNANGQVFLINPNGVIFGAGAQVNVGGLVASTLDISSSSGNTASFAGNSTGSVINLGKITAANGGYIALLGNHVSNQGVISAQLGTVALGAGSAITLTFNGSNLVRMVVDQSVLNTLADNGGLIQADGGKVLMTAGAAKSLLASVVNNTGVIEARTVNQQGGTITLLGGMQNGTVNVAGTLDASAPSALNGQGGNGGFIETSAANVQVANGAKVTTAAATGAAGTWLIDPTDFTISAGSDALTTSGMGASTLGTSLGSGNVSIATSATAHGSDLGDINVNASVTWSANQLTLTAHNNININANLNGSGTASLALQYGQGAVAAGNTSSYNLNNGAQVNLPAGPNFSTLLGSNGAIKNYTVITSLGATNSTTATDLQGINGGRSGNYALGGNIDASSTTAWNTGAGFTPIGNNGNSYSGKFDGLGHTISSLTINRPSQDKVGLFGQTSAAAVIQNVGLVGATLNGFNSVGGLVGSNYGKISNSYATGSVSGNNYVGGLVGYNSGRLSNSYATGSVSGSQYVGGLVGFNIGGSISNSYATGSVTGSGYFVGGLVGYNYGTISNSYATGSVTGSVTGSQYVGGLVGGQSNNSTISNSYATGSVTGSKYVGGLVGYNNGTINNSYATGSVTGSNYVGGLVGRNSSTISNSYATGSVTGSGNYVGGLVGYNDANISNSYATGSVTGSGNYVGGLVGYSYGGTISNSYATGSVSGSGTYVGGLVGYNYGGSISNSYATGSVTGSNYVGGLVGLNNGTVDNSYATGSVTGSSSYVGGLVGYNYGSISNSYATGSVSGSGTYVGGLVGYNYGTISNSYATGSVSGSSSNVGGLVGFNYGWISNGYWNTTNNPTLSGVGAASGSQSSVNGLTSQQMQTASNFAGFTFTTTPGATGNNWVIVDKDGSLNNTGGAAGATSPMLASEYSTSIVNAHQLQLMAMAPTASYTLAANINAAATAGGDVWGRVSAGFVPTFAPIGNWDTPFAGTFNGLGHTVSNLTINLPNQLKVGLFGQASAASVIQNVGLVDVNVTGDTYVGGLVAVNGGTVSNSYATGSVKGTSIVGGLVGINNGTVDNSYATTSLIGDTQVGGLVGVNQGTVTNSYATGSVSGSNYVGGLVGTNYNATISNSYATGSVNGNSDVGGLVGMNRSTGTINNSYATGSVIGSHNVEGGLVGFNYGTISNSYATGSISGSSYVGGLVGANYGSVNNSYASGSVSGNGDIGGLAGWSGGSISNSYSTGSVSGSGAVGGLVGWNSGTITNGYWNTTNNPSLSGVASGDPSGATGLTTQQMQTASNFAGFTFTTTPGDAGWVIVNTDGTLNNAGGATGATSPMLATEYATSIHNAHQLQLMAMAPSASYSLGANINAAATAGGDVWGRVSDGFTPTFAPIGNAGTPFSGTFDGMGHTISGLTINLPTQDNVGLFGTTSAASVIQNVGLVGGSVSGNNYVGGLVGLNEAKISNSYATGSVNGSRYVGGLVGSNLSGGTISNSYATGSVTGSGYYVGGLAGQNGAEISNSYATGSVTGSGNYVGGLVGYSYGGTISNSYATGSVDGSNNYVGGLVGYNSGTINNSYATGSVSGSSNVGGLVGYNYGLISNGYWNTTNNPTLSGVGAGSGSGATGLTTQEMQTASNFAGFTFTTTPGDAGWVIVNTDGTLNNAGGATGATSPMLATEYSTTIINAHQLQLMAMDRAASYTLGANINAAATAGGDVWGRVSVGFTPTFAPVGKETAPFSGTFDGMGHTISNLTINLPSQDNVGLFGKTSAASVIQNVGLVGGSVTGSQYVGGLVGRNSSTISNSYATGSVAGSGNYVGGLVGRNYGTISNSYASGRVSGSNAVGGLVGYNDANISNSYATGNVTGSGNYVGGLVGSNDGSINSSYATGSVTGSNYVGGLVGWNTSTINNSYATGDVTGGHFVGGFVGYQNGTISGSYETGNVTGSGSYVGSLVGYNDGTISTSYRNTTNNPLLTAVGGGDTSGVNGLTTQDMQTASNFAGFTFTTTPGASGNNWVIVDKNGTLNNAGSAAGATSPMLASEYSTSINNAHQLQLMAMAPAASYTLAGNINAAATAGGDVWGRVSAGFVPTFAPVGNATTSFSGAFDGLGHTISGLTINLPSQDNLGLFGSTSAGSVIQNVGLVGGSVSGSGNNVGGLVGANHDGTISNSYATGSVTGSGNNVGGLVGWSNGTVSNSYATGNVTGSGDYVGGLMGANIGTLSNSYATSIVSGTGDNFGGLVGANLGTLSNSYATGDVSGNNNVGGLVGRNFESATISNSYATGSVSGSGYVGGLVGRNLSTISNSYATGSVTGSNYVGGLVGFNYGTISNSYATGSVSGSNYVGGLVGYNYGGSISNSYATGSVSGSSYVGGLVGINDGGTINNGYWNSTNNPLLPGVGAGSSTGATGLTSAEMTQASSFASWDISKTGGSSAVWRIYEGHTAPLLRSFLTPLTLSDAPDASETYNGSAQSGATTANGLVLGAAATGTNAGFYNGYYSTQRGYDITGGNLTITGAALSAISMSGTRAYDGTADVAASIFTLTGLVGSEDLVLSGVGTISSKNVGTYNSVGLGTLALGNGSTGLASNYTFTGGTRTAIITKADLNVTGLSASGKVYDASTSAALTGIAVVSKFGSDDVTLGGTAVGTFADKNVGTGKTVTVTGNSITGADADNYNLVQQTGLTASISKADLVVSGLSASGKVYNASTNAALTGTAAVTALGSDVVTLDGTAVGTFADKNVGNSKAVTVTGVTLAASASDNDNGNYNLVQQTGLSASITKADLNVTGLSASSRVYNALTSATLTGTASVSALGSDVVTLGGTAVGTFADKNVGSGKAVTVTGKTLAGADAGNYNLVQQTGLTASISKANLIVSGLSTSGKVYDTLTSAALTGTARVTALGSDVVTLGGTAVGTFASKDVGSRAVTVTGKTLSGTDAGNYNLIQQSGLSAIISKANLVVSGLSASSKVYDTLTTDTLTGTARVTALGSDVVTLGGTAVGTFADKNVGINKAVTVTGKTLSGADAGNYNLVQQTGLTASISKANLVVSGLSATDKVYDALTTDTLTGTAKVTALGSDKVTLTGTAVGTFASKDVGSNKAVTVTGKTLSGTDAGNYNLVQQTGLTASISKANLLVTGLIATGKVYDALTTDTLTGTARVSALGSDVVSLGGTAVGTFASKDVGINKVVTVTGKTLSGTDAGNYNLVQQTGLTATITKANLVVSGLSATDKVYDGLTTDTLTGTARVSALGSDKVTLTGTAVGTFADKNVGTGKAVTVTGKTLTGTDAGNYNLVQQTGLSANISNASAGRP